ncbi:MAG TPA: hypothetical protein ENI27_01270 [bacterium]|nr:hypothetical protein [bacterium]
MNFLKNLPIIGNIFGKVIDVVAEVVPDKGLQLKIKTGLSEKILAADFSLLEKEMAFQAQTLAAELTGSKIQRRWRPHLMYLIMFFLLWLVIIVPMLGVFGLVIPVKEALESVPTQMWTLLTVGVGGYTVLRSGEKMVQSWISRPGK